MTTETEPEYVVIDQGKRLSRSLLWKLQRRFFERRGVAAWSEGTVPHYITSNPAIAAAYARVVLGWLRDGLGPGPRPFDRTAPVHVIELGAGSGRFAHLFLKRFVESWQASGLREMPVRYVMTDVVEGNVAFWGAHPALRPFVASGLLDFALFDPEVESEVRLQVSGEVLSEGTARNPVAVLANYVFDGMTHDLFSVVGGRLHDCLVTVTAPGPEPDLFDTELLERIRLSYERRPYEPDGNYEPAWCEVLSEYERRLDDTTILFPVGPLHCLRNLGRMAGGRLLLLSADKGHVGEESLMGQGDPAVGIHGSFSLMVNYDALGKVFARQGGAFLVPEQPDDRLAVCAFLLGESPGRYIETRLAIDEAILRSGPDEHFTLKKAMERFYDQLSLEEIQAYLRATGWDENILLGCCPTLLERLPSASEPLKREMQRIIGKVWDSHYALHGRSILPETLGALLYAMGYYPEALDFLGERLRTAGASARTCYQMALCHSKLRRMEDAARHLERSLELDPAFPPARALRASVELSLGRPLGAKADRADPETVPAADQGFNPGNAGPG